MMQILHISVYGAKMDPATSARNVSLERTRFALSFDANNSILVFVLKCTFFHIIMSTKTGLTVSALWRRLLREVPQYN